jgi:hypothetical protein
LSLDTIYVFILQVLPSKQQVDPSTWYAHPIHPHLRGITHPPIFNFDLRRKKEEERGKTYRQRDRDSVMKEHNGLDSFKRVIEHCGLGTIRPVAPIER